MAVHVHVNCAITLDGAMGGPGRVPLEISNREDKLRVHRLRARSHAILVGVGTVLADDPKLTVKWHLLGRRRRRQPLRVVLDPHLRTPARARILDATAPTVLFARPDAPGRPKLPVERVPVRGSELDLRAVLARLEKRRVRRLMVEGGGRTLARFFQQDLVDAATIFVAPRVLGAPDVPRLAEEALDLRPHLRLVRVARVGDGALLEWTRA